MYIPTEVRESIILPSSPMRFFRQNTIFFLWIFMKQSTVISLSCFKSENILDFGEKIFYDGCLCISIRKNIQFRDMTFQNNYWQEF